MGCSRCGTEGHTEYAPDGQAYCSSCIFYGLNKPCWKCRMYLPSMELQYYRGQLTCQYCMMDLRDAERAEEPKASTHRPSHEAHLAHVPEDERCDRCRRKLSIVYIMNSRKLCEICVEREKKEWESKGTGARPMPIRYKIQKDEGLLVKAYRALESFVVRQLEIRSKKTRPKPPA